MYKYHLYHNSHPLEHATIDLFLTQNYYGLQYCTLQCTQLNCTGNYTEAKVLLRFFQGRI